MSICLVLLCRTGFLEILMALMLSQNKVMTSFSDIIFFQHLLHPKKLSTTTSCCYVLSLCSWQRHTILLFAEPRDQIVPKKEASSRGYFSIISPPCPVSITISC